jgi:hypothetical protein
MMLIDGRIPAYQECPFRKNCEIATAGNCYHKGIEHNVEFSCAAARGFELINSYKKESKHENSAKHSDARAGLVCEK